jgi:chemotaxis protein CheX
MIPALDSRAKSAAKADPGWVHLLECAAREVFQIMVHIDLEVLEKPEEEPSGDMTAMVGLAGALCGVLSVRCSSESAGKIAASMLGTKDSPCRQETYDALAEVCNMVAGNFKAKVSGLGDSCMLSVPTVVCGEDYQFFPMADGQRLDLATRYEGSPLWVSLALHP